jgi:ABC-type polysaccharide/polyol phosphate transport system ATPase subunit
MGPPSPNTAGVNEAAVVVEGVTKGFSVPNSHQQTLKAQVIHPLRRQRRPQLSVLEDVSFEVKRGEFFGVAGRNASGKSTLLKLLAGIYRVDKGRIAVAPRVAPIIELGVGFQPELAARDNVLLNAEMMGVPAADAERRFSDVIDFAELEEFVDLKLKNYSSGMRVRLAFAIALLTDADLYLFDEVLAVGDAGFQQKCQNAFVDLKNDPEKTVILVTHSMTYIERFCDRALLLEDGKTELVGDPRDVSRRYAELLLEGAAPEAATASGTAVRDYPLEITSVWLEDGEGGTVRSVSADDDLAVGLATEVRKRVGGLDLRLEIRDATGARIFAPPYIPIHRPDESLVPGSHLDLFMKIENRLAPGRYTVTCSLWDRSGATDQVVSSAQAASFQVAQGSRWVGGLVDLRYELNVRQSGVEPVDQPGRTDLA